MNKDKNTNPVISVCVQTYQHAPYIRRTLDSILMQKTQFSFEIIIGEDESTDGTREICQEYALNNPDKIRLFLRSRDKVVHVNGNPTGRHNFIQNIKAAKGKYIANCPGDDYWTDPYKLQKQVKILESHPEYVACFHETQLVNEDGSLGKIYGHDVPQILTAEDTISTVSPFHSSSIVFRKDAFCTPDWFYNVVSGDMAFFSIISKKGNFIKIPEIMSHYYKHKGGLTNTSLVKDNLHSDRIILVNYLNSFHEYKYHEKSKQVISYHHSHLKENQSHFINVESNYFDRIVIHQLPNHKFKQEPRVNTPPTMLNDSEIKLLYWLSKDFFTCSGKLVELGSWLGGSTAAFAQGILKNKTITSKKIFSYDNFIWTPWYNKYNLDIKKSVGDSFLDIYLQNINPWKEIIDVRHCDVCELGWHGDPIELLFIDIMKSLDTAKCVAHSFFPSLIPEKSLIIHQDYKHFHEFWIHMMMFRLRKHLIPVLNIPDAPTVVFKCIKQINHADIDFSCSFDTFTKNEINNAFQFSLDIAKKSNNIFVDEIKKANSKAIEHFKNVHPKSTHSITRVINHSTSQNDNFLNPKISTDFCDLYIVRKTIKEKLNQSLKLFSGNLLDVGCGQMPYKEFILNSNPSIQKYIGLDFDQGKYADLKHPDITWNGQSIPLEDASIDCAMATEVLEHCHDPLTTLKEIRRVLKPNGIFFFTVPFLWPIHDAPHDHYRYTPFAMQKLLSDADFENIKIEAMGGWNASLAQMIGLWLNRAPMTDKAREMAKHDLIPLYKQLINTDIIPSNFEKGPMITGLSGVAHVPIKTLKSITENQMTQPLPTNTAQPKIKHNRVICPICKNEFEEFLPYGRNKRKNASCPVCHSLERHRLLWLFLQRKTNFFTKKLSILDVAPTMGFSDLIKNLDNIHYTSIDIQSKHAMLHMDLTKLTFEDNTFDCIICYHVLEHIPDDMKAMRELCRVLKPTGWAIIQVPLLKNTYVTREDLSITSPEIRRKLYGQEDHVRYYGLDYKDRLESAGFDVKIDNFASKLAPTLINRFRIIADENIYYCTKALQKNKDQKSTHKDIIIVKNFPKLSETFIMSQITGLLDRGHNIEIWAQKDPKEDTIHPDVHKYALLSRTKYIKNPKVDFENPVWRDEFFGINDIDNKSINLFHIHFGVTFNELAPLFAVHDQNIIVSFHGADASEYLQQYGSQYYNDLFQRANLIIVHSKVMKRTLNENGCMDDKILVHRYGVDLEAFYPSHISKSDDEIIFLSVARLVEKKGLHYSLRAFAKLDTNKKKTYLIIGEGPLDTELKELSKALNIEDNVVFLGHKDNDAVQQHMRKAHVFVLTSVTAENGDQEGLPVTLIEAHASGLPVISTHHAGIPELVIDGETGFLCEEKSVSCIVTMMNELVDNDILRNQFSISARNRVKNEFNLESLNMKLSSIYKSFGSK